jgi:hypothetical protein
MAKQKMMTMVAMPLSSPVITTHDILSNVYRPPGAAGRVVWSGARRASTIAQIPPRAQQQQHLSVTSSKLTLLHVFFLDYFALEVAEAAAVGKGIIATTDANKQGVRFDWWCTAGERPSMYVIILHAQ